MVVVLGPLRRLVEVADVEVLVQLGEAVLPTHAGGRRDHADRRPARQHVAGEQLVDHVAVPDEVDALDAGGAVRDTGTREQRVHRTAALVDRRVDRRLVRQVQADRLHTRQRDLGSVHDDDLGARVLDELGRRRAHAGRASDDEHALALVAVGVEQAHVLLPMCDTVVRSEPYNVTAGNVPAQGTRRRVRSAHSTS